MEVLNSHHGCPACGSPEKPEPIYRKAGYQILRCVTCGLGSTALDDRFDPVTLYSADYFQGNQADGYADYIGSESVLRREFRNVVRSLIHHARTRGRLFEIGCAYGFFLLEARKHFEVHGIEVAADAAKHCRSQGLDVATGIETDECMARRGPFDIVVMLDIIEYLQNPLEVLKIANSNLNSGGAYFDFHGRLGQRSKPPYGLGLAVDDTSAASLFFLTKDHPVHLVARRLSRCSDLEACQICTAFFGAISIHQNGRPSLANRVVFRPMGSSN